MICVPLIVPFLVFAGAGLAQETASTVEPPRTADLSFTFEIVEPAYASGQGPTVLLDEAHHNFHTAEGTYAPFVSLLENDGYVVERGLTAFKGESLKTCGILVIADAQPPSTEEDPPTFSFEEVSDLATWVRDGGRLFLITDHRPDPGAIDALAKAFGIKLHNGYALSEKSEERSRPVVFSRDEQTLVDHPITNGRAALERVSSVATFAGSAFRAGEDFEPILIFPGGFRSYLPGEYWQISNTTPSVDIEGWYQGGVMRFGEGRVAVFAEAAMFTAQIFDQGRVRVGMNHELGQENAQLLLNVMHWLSEGVHGKARR